MLLELFGLRGIVDNLEAAISCTCLKAAQVKRPLHGHSEVSLRAFVVMVVLLSRAGVLIGHSLRVVKALTTSMAELVHQVFIVHLSA
jgi:hypothetical protein